MATLHPKLTNEFDLINSFGQSVLGAESVSLAPQAILCYPQATAKRALHFLDHSNDRSHRLRAD